METKKVDRKPDVLVALKSACELEDKKEIVANVLDCILNAFSNLDYPCEMQDGSNTNLISREQFIIDMNYFITELKKYNNK